MTAKFKYDVDAYEEYLPTATPREADAIRALLEHRAGIRAAAALGVTTSALHQRLTAARQRWTLAQVGAPPPDGFRVTKVAQRADGTVIAVQSKPDGGDHLERQPEGHAIKGVSTLYGPDGSVSAQWVKTNRRAQDQFEAFREAVRTLTVDVTPATLSAHPATSVDEDLCTILPWGDPHIGALSWAAETGHSWDLKIAEECTIQVLADLITRTPRSQTFVLADLGDLFHAEDDKQATYQSGHKLDVDSRAGKIIRVALRMFKTAIDLALTRHQRVSVRILRGNHDPYKSVSVGVWLEAVYANEPRVTVEPFDDPYQYFQFGQCGFMWHHGDGSKPAQMPGVFSCHDIWGKTRHRYIQSGHIHTQNRWDFAGCTVESFRTVFPGDFWSHWKGYRSRQTLDAITYHRELGEISRLQQGVRR